MNQTVRVYVDGRICVPASVLTAFRKKSKNSRKAVWISLFDNGKDSTSILLSWNECTGTAVQSSKKYDLSVRDRVLFNAPKGVASFRHKAQYNYRIDAMAIQINLGSQAFKGDRKFVPKPRKKVETRPAPIKKSQRSRRPRSLSLEAQFDASFRVKLCEILSTPEYSGITLEQIAKVMPDLTIREIVSA